MICGRRSSTKTIRGAFCNARRFGLISCGYGSQLSIGGGFRHFPSTLVLDEMAAQYYRSPQTLYVPSGDREQESPSHIRDHRVTAGVSEDPIEHDESQANNDGHSA